MTQETKEFVDNLKFRCLHFESELFKAGKIIESQEKEIERLKEDAGVIKYSNISNPSEWEEGAPISFKCFSPEDTRKAMALFEGMAKEIRRLQKLFQVASHFIR